MANIRQPTNEELVSALSLSPTDKATRFYLCRELWKRAGEQYATIKCRQCPATFDNFTALEKHFDCHTVVDYRPDPSLVLVEGSNVGTFPCEAILPSTGKPCGGRFHSWREYIEHFRREHLKIKRSLRHEQAILTEHLVHLINGLGTCCAWHAGYGSTYKKEKFWGIAQRSGPRAGLAFVTARHKGASVQDATYQAALADLWIYGVIGRDYRLKTDLLLPAARVAVDQAYRRIISQYSDLPEPLRSFASTWLPALDGHLSALAIDVLSVATARVKKMSQIEGAIVGRQRRPPSGPYEVPLDSLLPEYALRSAHTWGEVAEYELQFQITIAAAKMDSNPQAAKVVQLYLDGESKVAIYNKTGVSRPTIDAILDRTREAANGMLGEKKRSSSGS